MFRTLGNTWKLIKISWTVLQKDRELILFPIMSGIGILIVVGIAAGVFGAIGTFERLDSTDEAEVNAGDIIVGVAALFGAFFMVNYFNAALIAAARHRLKGGDPNLRTGFSAVNKHLPAVLGWTVIGTIIFVILQYLRGQSRGFLGQIVIGLVGAAWAYMTFFVIPVLIIEGVGPIEAIKRSAGYFRRTWGEQLVSNFGFGLLQMVAVIPAVIVVAVLSPISPVAAIIAGVPVLAIGLGTVMAMEGIFKAALYEYVSEGQIPEFYDRETLEGAYAVGGTGAYRGGRGGL